MEGINKGDAEWISVDDDLPEYGQIVFWFDVSRGVYAEGKKKSAFPLNKRITYWCKLIPHPHLIFETQTLAYDAAGIYRLASKEKYQIEG